MDFITVKHLCLKRIIIKILRRHLEFPNANFPYKT